VDSLRGTKREKERGSAGGRCGGNTDEEGITRHIINKSAFVCPLYDVREIAAVYRPIFATNGARLLSRPTRYVMSGNGADDGTEVCEHSRDKRYRDCVSTEISLAFRI